MLDLFNSSLSENWLVIIVNQLQFSGVKPLKDIKGQIY